MPSFNIIFMNGEIQHYEWTGRFTRTDFDEKINHALELEADEQSQEYMFDGNDAHSRAKNSILQSLHSKKKPYEESHIRKLELMHHLQEICKEWRETHQIIQKQIVISDGQRTLPDLSQPEMIFLNWSSDDTDRIVDGLQLDLTLYVLFLPILEVEWLDSNDVDEYMHLHPEIIEPENTDCSCAFKCMLWFNKKALHIHNLHNLHTWQVFYRRKTDNQVVQVTYGAICWEWDVPMTELAKKRFQFLENK